MGMYRSIYKNDDFLWVERQWERCERCGGIWNSLLGRKLEPCNKALGYYMPHRANGPYEVLE